MAPKRKSASSAVLKEVQQQDSETVTPLNRETVEQQSGETGELYYGETAERLISNTVTQQHGITAEQLEKTTFYLEASQSEKLDDLAHDYKKRTGQRINRNDIVRYLIDQATLDSLEGIKRHVRQQGQQMLAEHPGDEAVMLKQRLAIEERFRTDTEVRHFKKWLRSHDQPQDSDFAKRFLADTRLPQHASRSVYEARLRLHDYSAEDLLLFQAAWKAMLFTQSGVSV